MGCIWQHGSRTSFCSHILTGYRQEVQTPHRAFNSTLAHWIPWDTFTDVGLFSLCELSSVSELPSEMSICKCSFLSPASTLVLIFSDSKKVSSHLLLGSASLAKHNLLTMPEGICSTFGPKHDDFFLPSLSSSVVTLRAWSLALASEIQQVPSRWLSCAAGSLWDSPLLWTGSGRLSQHLVFLVWISFKTVTFLLDFLTFLEAISWTPSSSFKLGSSLLSCNSKLALGRGNASFFHLLRVLRFRLEPLLWFCSWDVREAVFWSLHPDLMFLSERTLKSKSSGLRVVSPLWWR